MLHATPSRWSGNPIGTYFNSSTTIYFNEFQYFTKISDAPDLRKATNLKEITFPSSVQRIANNCYDGCSSLISCVLNEGLKTIGRNVWNYTKFVTMTIPSTVTSIDGRDFVANYNLRSVLVLAVNPPSNPTFNLLNAANSSVRIYVPDDSLSAYKAASKWSEIASRIYPISEYAG